MAELTDGGLEELDVPGPLVVPEHDRPPVGGLGGGEFGGRVPVGQGRPHRLGDLLGRHPRQRRRTPQAALQVLLALRPGEELVAKPVHAEQQGQDLDVAAGRTREVDGLCEVPHQPGHRGVQDAGQILGIRNRAHPLGQLLDKQIRVPAPARIAEHM